MTSQCQYTKVTKYLVTIECEQPLHVGSAEGGKDGILLNPVTGLPFLQAYGMAGAMREYVRKVYGEDARNRLFGIQEEVEGKDGTCLELDSMVKITDGTTETGKFKTELRPHVRIDGRTGTADSEPANQIQSGQKFEMMYVSAGSLFCFQLYYFGKDDTKKDERILESCLQGIHAGEIQFGGKKSEGCGTFSIRHANKYTYDLQKEKERKLWFQEESGNVGESGNEEEFMNLTESLQTSEGGDYVLELSGKASQGILVKSIVSLDIGRGKPGAENMENGNGEYVLPGSSIKGVLRSRVELILSYLEQPHSIGDDIFGTKSMKDGEGSVGNAFFTDCMVKQPAVANQSRIHIDKFTGGTFYSSLFQESPVSGELNIRVRIKDSSEGKAKRSCGLLLMAFRDIALGEVGFGSGASIGRGFLDVSRFSLECQGEKAEVDWTKQIVTGNQEIIPKCLHACNGGTL